MSDLHYDPYSDEALREPHPIYKRLRAEKPASLPIPTPTGRTALKNTRSA